MSIEVQGSQGRHETSTARKDGFTDHCLLTKAAQIPPFACDWLTSSWHAINLQIPRLPRSKRILDEIEQHGIKIYHLPDAESDEDEDFKEQTRLLKVSIPFCVVGSNQLIEAKGKKVRGRLYPWGVVEVENPEHNDFLKLRTMLITHMQDLQEVTQDLHYENFRSERLKRGGRLSMHDYSLPLSPLSLPFCLSFPFSC
ncbi:septin-2-like [Macrochelys suwanniensis]